MPRYRAAPPLTANYVRRLGNQLRLLGVCLLSLALSGCDGCIPIARSSRTILFPARPLREISAPEPDGDFQDLDLVITDAALLKSGTAIVASGLHHGRPVSIRVVITRRAARDGDSAVRLESLGADSDAFISSLADIYKAAGPLKMKKVAIFDAIALAGDPANLSAKDVKLKLFCHTRIEAEYCELYLNADTRTGVVEIAEKDPGYRQAVISWLKQP